MRNRTARQIEMNRLASRARKYKVSVIIPFTKGDVIKRDGLNCYLCEKELDFSSATIDHIKPLSSGGWHCLSNAKICCRPCNNKKYNKSLENYLNENKSL